MTITNAAAVFEGLAEAADAGVVSVLGPVVERVVAEARAAWPVRTGRSRLGLRIVVRRLPDGSVTWEVRNDVPYSGVIFDRKRKPAPTWLRILKLPLREALRSAGPDVVRELARG